MFVNNLYVTIFLRNLSIFLATLQILMERDPIDFVKLKIFAKGTVFLLIGFFRNVPPVSDTPKDTASLYPP